MTHETTPVRKQYFVRNITVWPPAPDVDLGVRDTR